MIGQDSHSISYSNDLEVSEHIDSLAKICWELRESDSDSSLIVGLLALNLADKHGLNKQISKLSNYVGVVHMHYLYKYKESIKYFQRALQTSIALKDSLQMAYAYNNLGDVYLMSGNIPLALQYAQISFTIFDKLKNESGLAYAYINLAEAYRENKEYKKSLEYFNKASQIRKVLNSPEDMGFVLFNEAKTFEEVGDYEKAMSFYKQSLELSYDVSDFRYVSWCLSGIANVYFAEGNYQSAEDYYQQALNWNKERNYEYGFIDNYIGLALVYANQHKTKEGEKLLNKALELASTLEINSQIVNAYNSYFKFYKIIGDYNKAITSFEIFLNHYDSILSTQQFEIVNELQRNFTIQQNLINAEQEIKTNKLLRRDLLSIIMLLLVLASIFIWLYYSKKKMNKKLEEINETKNKLFSVISHDLKNPFNSLIGFSEILQVALEEKNYEQAQEFAKHLHKSSVEGYNLLTNLLHWSLSQRGKIQYKPELISIKSLFSDLEDLFRSQAADYKLALTFNHKIDQIVADYNILKIILVNLITNALKYTQEKGKVIVSCEIQNTSILITVRDTGIGISNEIISLVTNNKNIITSRKGLRKETGTGLGLSVINDLVYIHHGTLKIDSEIGTGSTFIIDIPYQALKE